MKNEDARAIGEELKVILERLRVMAKPEWSRRSSEAEALEVAIVNLDSAIEILME